MALGTRVAAGAATLALALTGLVAATAPADAATAPSAHGNVATPDTFRMEYFAGTGGTIAIAQQQAYLEAQMRGFWSNQCSTVQTTGQPGGYYVTILCEAWT